MDRRKLPRGVYEKVVTDEMAQDLSGEEHFETLQEPDAGRHISRFVQGEVSRVFKEIVDIPRQEEVASKLLKFLYSQVRKEQKPDSRIASPPRLLRGIYRGPRLPRPETPLSTSSLLSKPGKPVLGNELALEIQSADRIDALISFVKTSGLRRLRSALESHARDGKKIRLLTTTYTGATDAEAVIELARLRGVEVRVSFDGRRNRLHAKAWLFHRDSGYTTGYIGSANISASALTFGLEWTMKVTQSDLPHVIEAFSGTFEGLWEDPEFEAFDPERDADRLRSALARERGNGTKVAIRGEQVFFQLAPFPFQQEILEKLDEERQLRGSFRNLIVAATGTGKTMIAAFDYKRQANRPRLLFVAHRKEILEQALAAFREVLQDHAFGGLLVGNEQPSSYEHTFASIQSLRSGSLIDKMGADYWQYVVVDECHHLPAPSYRDLAARLRPAIFLGLTATPERQDNESLLPDFSNRIAAEIRIWHAINRELIAPFEYFGISDGTDLQSLAWNRGSYRDDALEQLYLSNLNRAQLVADQSKLYTGNWTESRGLGFCVSVEHAKFMARVFCDNGITAEAIHGLSSPQERTTAAGRLMRREVRVLFTCDLFNEGVDLPFVDTLLFLRPTSSATLFLQQLGRGLRLSEDKARCLVLDFIGHHRKEFSFDPLLSAMSGIPRGRLIEATEKNFPMLPLGCSINLDRVAQDQILENLKRTISGGKVRLAKELLRFKSSTMAAFIDDSGRPIADIYSAGGWTAIRREAGVLNALEVPGEEQLNRKMKLLLHIDDADRLELYSGILSSSRKPTNDTDRTQMLMLGYQIQHEVGELLTAEEAPKIFDAYPELKTEASELMGILKRKARPGSPPRINLIWPLALHRTYSLREILTAIGSWTERAKPRMSEGVLRLPGLKAELLFVTLDKEHKTFSPSTQYQDYAISPDRFHWQSQNAASDTSDAGRRYIEQAINGWSFFLFLREAREDSYLAAGKLTYLSHEGNRPINIVWHLEHPLPMSIYEEAAKLSQV